MSASGRAETAKKAQSRVPPKSERWSEPATKKTHEVTSMPLPVISSWEAGSRRSVDYTGTARSEVGSPTLSPCQKVGMKRPSRQHIICFL